MHLFRIQQKRPVGRTNSESGFNLVEIIVAATILSLSLLSIIVIAGQSITISHRSLNTYVASTLLEEGAESVRIVRDGGWSNISSLTVGTTYYPKFNSGTNTWSLTTTSSDGTVGIFTRSVVLGTAYRDGSSNLASSGTSDSRTKYVTITVTWKESTGSTITKTLSFYLADVFT